LHLLLYKDIVANAVAEDLGFGDNTTDNIFGAEKGKAEIVAKEAGIVAGLPVCKEVFAQVDKTVQFYSDLNDGDSFEPGDRLALLTGQIEGILSAERVALNFLQRISGIASATRLAVEAVQGTKAVIVDTRKTTPGLRVLEKYAVRMGGGKNHRFNLSDMVMIKDNHIRGAGSIAEAVARIKLRAGIATKIEVEAATIEDVEEALYCSVDIIMLDNMSTDKIAEAVKMINGRALVEASGGIGYSRLEEVASAGVDFISLGYLTHSCRALDLSLNIIEIDGR